jgi:asparagine synthase (glutamine-hydrolysing)
MTLAMLGDRTSPLLELINQKAVLELALSINKDTDIPWFGQLMNAPQLLAYLMQIDFWLKEYQIVIE